MFAFSFPGRFLALFALTCLMLSGCGGMSSNSLSQREIPSGTPSEAVQNPPTDSASALRLARILRDQGRYEGALGVYAQLDRRGGLKPLELLEYAGVASLIQPPRDTFSLFVRAEKALTDQGGKIKPENIAVLHIGLGRARMALGQSEAARRDLEKALEASPDNITALNAMGVLLDSLGEHAEAQKMFGKANALDPADARILNNLALSHLGTGDPDKAVRLLNQARSLSDSPSLGLNLSFTYYMRGQDALTRSTLQEFMQPEQAETFMNMFRQMKGRVNSGDSTVSEELLQAAGKLVEIKARVDSPAGALASADAGAQTLSGEGL